MRVTPSVQRQTSDKSARLVGDSRMPFGVRSFGGHLPFFFIWQLNKRGVQRSLDEKGALIKVETRLVSVYFGALLYWVPESNENSRNSIISEHTWKDVGRLRYFFIIIIFRVLEIRPQNADSNRKSLQKLLSVKNRQEISILLKKDMNFHFGQKWA